MLANKLNYFLLQEDPKLPELAKFLTPPVRNFTTSHAYTPKSLNPETSLQSNASQPSLPILKILRRNPKALKPKPRSFEDV